MHLAVLSLVAESKHLNTFKNFVAAGVTWDCYMFVFFTQVPLWHRHTLL